MTALQLTLLTALVTLLLTVLVYVWVVRLWLRGIVRLQAILQLPENDTSDKMLEVQMKKVNRLAKIEILLYPFTSQIKYLFAPTLILLALSFLF